MQDIKEDEKMLTELSLAPVQTLPMACNE